MKLNSGLELFALWAFLLSLDLLMVLFQLKRFHEALLYWTN
jgi:hypothetical protein